MSDSLYLALEKDPVDVLLWCALADWYEEEGDPHAHGVRHMIVGGKYPLFHRPPFAWEWWESDPSLPPNLAHALLPKPTFAALEGYGRLDRACIAKQYQTPRAAVESYAGAVTPKRYGLFPGA